ncbi:MAG: hypothetical protein HY939_05340 [Gammaproteobacteria bacterium]|nr:hypothetical protein [Gammaproteobacteria bacterium]
MLKKTRRVLAVTTILLALSVWAGRVMITHLTRQTQYFEQLATKALGYPVEIQQVSTSWRGFYPQFVLQQVSVKDENNEALIQINHLNVGVNFLLSLWHWDFIPGNLEVQGAKLSVFQDELGHWKISGRVDNGEKNAVEINRWINWLLSEKHILLSDIQITLQRKNEKNLSLQISKVELFDRGDKTYIEGDAAFSRPQSSKVHVIAELTQSLGLSLSSAKIYLEANNVDLKVGSGIFSFNQGQINQGIINAKIWADWKNNQWEKFQFVCQGEGVEAQYEGKNYLLNFSPINLIITPTKAQNWQIQGLLSDVKVNQHLLIHEPIEFIYQQGTDQKEFQVSHLSFSLLNQLASQWGGLSKDNLSLLNQLDLNGDLRDVYFKQEKTGWLLDGDVDNLTSQPKDKIPGVVNLSGHFQVKPEEGFFDLASEKISVTFLKVFRKTIFLDKAIGSAHWQFLSNDRFVVQVNNAQASNEDGVCFGEFSLLFDKDKPYPWLSLVGGGRLTTLNRESLYLPYSVMPPAVLAWVDQALIPGHAKTNATVILNGPMEHFPFDGYQGQFTVDADLDNVDLRIGPGWPPIQAITGNIVFNDRAMYFTKGVGRIYDNTTLRGLSATIPSMGAPGQATLLSIDGKAKTNIQEALQFIKNSPLQHIFKERFANTEGKGPLDLSLNLILPLSQSTESVQAKGELVFADDVIGVKGIDVENLKGSLSFTEMGLFSPSLTGRFLGHPLKIDISNTPMSGWIQTKINVLGTFSGELFEKMLSRFSGGDYIQGQSNFNALFTLNHAKGDLAPPPDSLKIQSDLSGLAINFPLFLQKPQNTTQATTLLIQWIEGNPLFDFNSGSMRVQVTKEQEDVRAQITNDIMSGKIYFPTNGSLLKARLDYLILPGTDHLKSKLSPKIIPKLDFYTRSLKIANKNIGSVSLMTSPTPAGLTIDKLTISTGNYQLDLHGQWNESAGRASSHFNGELKSDDLSGMLQSWGFAPGVVSNDASALFSLNWQGTPFDFNVKTLQGKLSIDIQNGTFTELASSTNLKIGLGRIITMLSVQSITQKLQLNFNDVTRKGFNFSSLKGEFDIDQGQARTEEVLIEGPVAKIKLSGRVGLTTHDYDLELWVTPYVTSSLPVIATIAGGPIVGAATWLTDKILSSAVQKLTTYHYHLTGPWDAPTVTPQ